jgi:hypothetical protein
VLVNSLEMWAKLSGPGDVNSETRQREHQSLLAGLLEVVVGGECFGEATPLHDYDGKAIGQAPILVAAVPIQIDSSGVELCGCPLG